MLSISCLLAILLAFKTGVYRKIGTKNVENFLVGKSVKKWRKAVLLHYEKC